MVTYYNNLYKKRRKRKTRILILVFLSFIGLVLGYVFGVIFPVVIEASEQMIFSLSTTAVSDAVYEVLKEENLKYQDIVNITYDSAGDVSLITLDTVKLNGIARRFYQVAQINLDKMGEVGIDVSLGTFTGIPFLVGLGPKVNLKLVSIGAMTSTFKNNFRGAGVNQTNHTLSIELFASVSLILPAYSHTIDSVTEVLVSESVIAGKVPQVYLGDNSSLNFIPNGT